MRSILCLIYTRSQNCSTPLSLVVVMKFKLQQSFSRRYLVQLESRLFKEGFMWRQVVELLQVQTIEVRDVAHFMISEGTVALLS